MFPVIPSHQIRNKFYVVEVIELVVGQVFELHKVAPVICINLTNFGHFNPYSGSPFRGPEAFITVSVLCCCSLRGLLFIDQLSQPLGFLPFRVYLHCRTHWHFEKRHCRCIDTCLEIAYVEIAYLGIDLVLFRTYCLNAYQIRRDNAQAASSYAPHV
jgi:hypothetical protein